MKKPRYVVEGPTLLGEVGPFVLVRTANGTLFMHNSNAAQDNQSRVRIDPADLDSFVLFVSEVQKAMERVRPSKHYVIQHYAGWTVSKWKEVRPSDSLYIIQHVSERDEETGELLTWNNELGWGLGEPTVYKADERAHCQLPGFDCKWVEKPEGVK